MKRIILAIAIIIGIAVSVQAGGGIYGKGITLRDITRISEIMEDPDRFIGKKVLVKGLVVGVCERRGCWMDIASDTAFQKIQIKVADGQIVFPLSAKGKEALVEGVVEKLVLSKEQTVRWYQHKAEEQGKKFDPRSVTEGETIYRIKGIGARIID